MKKSAFLLSVILTLASAQAHAASILYFTDYTISTDRMAEALAGLPGSYSTVTASNADDFATGISSGNYDLGIFMAQNFGAASYNSAVVALGAFAAGGGKAIYTDWSRSSEHGALFGVNYSGDINDTSFSITDSALSSGLNNPISLTNTGWGIFSVGLTGGTSAALFPSGSSAIAWGIGNNSIVNGFLNDTFTTGAEGVQLYTNEILALTSSPVPEGGSTVALLGLVFSGMAWMRRKL